MFAESARVRCSLFTFRVQGKAVRIGHSCAAVTHHDPPSRFERAKSQSASKPVKAEVRRLLEFQISNLKLRRARNAKSEDPP